MTRKINTWVTGIMLYGEPTDMPDGTKLGFDADFGCMYALNGKLVPSNVLLEYYDRLVAVRSYPPEAIKIHEDSSLYDRLVRAALSGHELQHPLIAKHW